MLPHKSILYATSRFLKIRSISVLFQGFPIALSYPHFYKSDPSILDAIEGMSPDEKRHETYFLINPVRR